MRTIFNALVRELGPDESSSIFEYTEPVIVPKGRTWLIPSGALTKCQ